MRQHINSRFDLAQYCLRKLGAPVIRINITEQQIDDRINDALDMFLQFHMDGSYRQVHVHTLTEEDIERKKIILPNTIMSVLAVYLKTDPSSNSISSSSNLQMQAYFSDLIMQTYNTQGSIANYALSQSYFGTLNSVMPNGLTRVTSYNIYSNELSIPDFKWKQAKEGDMIGLDAYVFKDPDEVGKVFNDYWLKQYTCALIKLQWANNISKFSNIALPGGGTLNGESLLLQAQQEISDLELKLQNQYSLPISPFMA